jgi:hypothetical protein
LKDETDAYNDIINKKVHYILQRDTDQLEMDTYLMYYRYCNESDLDPSTRLENELYESLEYHDILKDFIQERYNKVNKSELFKMLNTIIKCTNKMTKRNKETVFNFLDTNYIMREQ